MTPESKTDAPAAPLTRSDKQPMQIGVIGCGDVSKDYFASCARYGQLDVAACADVRRELAEEKSERFGVPRVLEPADLLADSSLELVVNLTPPAFHVDVTSRAIGAGKHVYTEKPMAPSLSEARSLLEAAAAADVELGSAPATFLGGGIQTSLKLIEDGLIGTPVAATAFITSRGYEHWHPAVDSYYGRGGGPMLDVGPYLISTLVALLGPASRVAASTRRVSETRARPAEFPGPPEIAVDVATHAAGTVDFEGGPIATVITSWEIWNTNLPYLEVYGTEGSLSVPNPDEFFGTPLLRRGEPGDLAVPPTKPSGGSWQEVSMTHRGDVGRGIAIADMADGIRSGRAFRANAELAFHVLEVMLAFDQASETGRHIEIASRCERPRPLEPAAAEQMLTFD